jgi:hypothetical protein
MNKALTHFLVPANIFVILLSASVARAHGHHRHGNSTSAPNSTEVRSCKDLDVEFDNRPAVVSEETLSLPGGSGVGLSISAAPNGGIWVRATDRGDFAVTACKAVADDGNADQSLKSISLSRGSGQLSVSGPAEGGWLVHFIVEAPQGSSVKLESENGPLSLHDFSGKARVESQNGPVSLHRVSGELDVRTENGPVTLAEGSGNVELTTENGPLSVRLADQRWQGGKLSGRTQNGPLSLKIAPGFTSGVRVAMSDHSPFHCESDACREAHQDFDTREKRVEFGSGATTVDLSTENGPVSIRSLSER